MRERPSASKAAAQLRVAIREKVRDYDGDVVWRVNTVKIKGDARKIMIKCA
jgi:hypothetical protein